MLQMQFITIIYYHKFKKKLNEQRIVLCVSKNKTTKQ